MKADQPGPASYARCCCLGLFKRRERWGLSARGCVVLLFAGAVLLFVAVRRVHPFLAVTAPLPGRVLVVEGWGGDDMLRAALTEFTTNRYERLCVTGGPIEKGAPFAAFGTWAEMGAATLAKFGADTNRLHAVPAPLVKRDRTYASAVALRAWLGAHDGAPESLTVFSAGPHSRRTRLLFSRALGTGTRVGIIAYMDDEYDAARWWTSSQGVRVVISETIAYTYARLFSPAEK